MGNFIVVQLGEGLMYPFGGGLALTPNVRLEVQFVSHSGIYKIFFDEEVLQENNIRTKLKYKRTSLGLIMTL